MDVFRNTCDEENPPPFNYSCIYVLKKNKYSAPTICQALLCDPKDTEVGNIRSSFLVAVEHPFKKFP